MKLYKNRKIALFAAAAMTSILVVGCMVIDNETYYTGVEDQTLKQIEAGKTTKDSLVAALGQPSEQELTEDSTEILRYTCTKKLDNTFVLFPVVVINDERETKHTVAFELKDGIVQRYWKER